MPVSIAAITADAFREQLKHLSPPAAPRHCRQSLGKICDKAKDHSWRVWEKCRIAARKDPGRKEIEECSVFSVHCGEETGNGQDRAQVEHHVLQVVDPPQTIP